MFHSYYATTKDKKNHEHNYRLPAGEGVPNGHEITNLSVAGRYKFAEIVGKETADLLKDLFPVRGKRYASQK
jgi:hypothetical protein